MNWQEFTKATGITYEDVEAERIVDDTEFMTLAEWLADGEYEGDEPAERLASKWDDAAHETNMMASGAISMRLTPDPWYGKRSSDGSVNQWIKHRARRAQ